MRHSRRAVMAERYKLYAKKNIFNSRYLVRNLQIGLLAFVFVAMMVGTVVLLATETEEDIVVADAKVSMKEALFSSTEEVATTEDVTVQETTTADVTESVIAEKVQAELDNTITEVVSSVVPKEEEKEEPKSEFDNKCIAKVDETLNVRSNPSADAEFVGQMNNGAIAIVQGVEGDWTKIKSGDVVGYVLTEYVLTGESAEEFAKNYVTLRGTILEDGVNIRAEKSTDAEILVVMDKDEFVTVLENPKDEDIVEEEADVATADEAATTQETTTQETTTEETITEEVTTEVTTTQNVTTEQKTESTTQQVEAFVKPEEAAQEIEWVSVMLEDGKVGYVSADLVKIDELYEIAVSAEELRRREEEAARKAAEEEAARQAAAAQAAAAAQQAQDSSNNYEGATTKPVTTTESGELIGTFTITAYCGCSKCGTGSNRTASGTTPTEGRTIAADTSILPFGTKVVIGGVVYTVEDSGSGVRGNHIDIFFATHARALAFGRKTMKVYKY